jgi:ferredoxin-NADP reductase
VAEPLDELAHRHEWFTFVNTFTRRSHDSAARFYRRIDADMLRDMLGHGHAGLGPRCCYVAGPRDMVLLVRAALVDLGVSDDHVYSEDHA